jgi:tRNA (guanine-N7-)-methyltransferase
MPRERGAADAPLPEVTHPQIVLDNTDLLTPLDLTAQFGPRPIHVDVGCGKGRFLMARAVGQPECGFLGIDRMQMRFTKLAGKIQTAGLSRTKLLRMEAGYAVEHLLRDASIACFYILFPDPWPKHKHHRRRLVQPSFITVVHSKLQRGGIIQFASDHQPYYAQVQELLADDTRFEEVEAMVPTAEERTDFERYYVSIDKPIGRCAYRKR